MPGRKKRTAKKAASRTRKPSARRKKPLKKKPVPKKSKGTVKSSRAVKAAPAKKQKAPGKTRPGSAKVTRLKPQKPKYAAPASTTPKETIAPYQPRKGEEYMSPAQVEHFRQLLQRWKRELMEEVDRTVHHMRDDAANFPDPNDRATQEEGFALELRTRDRERKLIRKIDESLKALEQGEYGYCEICGVEIGIRRLEARPAATLCIDCKTLDEIKERHMG